MKHLFFHFFLLFSVISCTTIHYKSTGLIPVYYSGQDKHFIKKTATGQRNFYLFGLIPNEHYVEVDSALRDVGLDSAAQVVIEEYQTALDEIFMVLSFGMYVSVHYKISSHGVAESEL